VIHFLPIEPLEERYTAQMLRWVEQALARTGQRWRTYLPTYASGPIAHGQFLDTLGSAGFKARQLLQLHEALVAGKVNPGDTILCGDTWFPGIEGIRQSCELLGLEVRFAGWFYAGVCDPADYYSSRLGGWAMDFESTMLRTFDAICIGSYSHGELIRKAHGDCGGRLHMCGLAWNADDVPPGRPAMADRIPAVVFPHRVAPEKNPAAFLDLARRYSNIEFCFSSCNPAAVAAVRALGAAPGNVSIRIHQSKADYYAFLGACRWFYSAALQETFGYAFHEAVAAGCHVVVPNRLAYRDAFAVLEPAARLPFVYDSDDPIGAACLGAALDAAQSVPRTVTQRYHRSADTFLGRILP
jgi:glycosyltransferase involved in cell wall biosynthesis